MILSDQTALQPATYYANHHLHMNSLNSRNIASAIQRCETQHNLIALTARLAEVEEYFGASSPTLLSLPLPLPYSINPPLTRLGDRSDQLYCRPLLNEPLI